MVSKSCDSSCAATAFEFPAFVCDSPQLDRVTRGPVDADYVSLTFRWPAEPQGTVPAFCRHRWCVRVPNWCLHCVASDAITSASPIVGATDSRALFAALLQEEISLDLHTSAHDKPVDLVPFSDLHSLQSFIFIASVRAGASALALEVSVAVDHWPLLEHLGDSSSRLVPYDVSVSSITARLDAYSSVDCCGILASGKSRVGPTHTPVPPTQPFDRYPLAPVVYTVNGWFRNVLDFQ